MRSLGFLDPLYSSWRAARSLVHRRDHPRTMDWLWPSGRGDTSAAQLGKWGSGFNEGVDRMRRLVCEFYAGFSFGAFVRRYPELRGSVTDLLIGDLFTERVDRVWPAMESLNDGSRPPIPAWALAFRAARRAAPQLICRRPSALIWTMSAGGTAPVRRVRGRAEFTYRRRVLFASQTDPLHVHFSCYFR
jgi:hypothetical protein